jgi:Fe-S oxidoreductase
VTGKCAICGREETLTRHHLIPRVRHRNKRNKREFDRVTVKEVVGICRPCHSQIHQLFTEKDLERAYNSIDKLRAHPELAKFAAWISAKPRGFRAAMRRSNARNLGTQ